MVSWRECEARHEAHLREQNEWIEAANESFGGEPLVETFVCECGDSDCSQLIRLSKAEYESVRSGSTRFAVAPNHENPESEGVISECARFAVVAKIEGWGLRIARATDPRSAHRPRVAP
jgi:hypothetical protein